MTDTLREQIARAMEPRAFETFARGYTQQNILSTMAFLNAERVVKRARKKADVALAAIEASGFKIVTADPESSVFKIETCPKCGAQGAAFICSTPGCPVNGGAAYGADPEPGR